MGQESLALEIRSVSKLYAGTVALNSVDLQVKKGEVHGLIGKNGAGKSTLVGIISGIVEPTMGEIIVNNTTYSSLSPILAKKQHISIITQEPQVIAESSVAENFFMPQYLNGKQIIDWKTVDQKSKEILAKAKFSIDVRQKMRDLSISEQQILLVIKACYVEKAEIVIMDEVSASLSQRDQHTLYGIIDDMISQGKTVIFISHHTEELLRVCHRLTVIRDGKTVSCNDTADLDLQSLSALIVGNDDYGSVIMDDKSHLIEDHIVLELEDFTHYGRFKHINLSLKKGEIVGLAGLRGSGRTEIMKSIVGLDRCDKGQIYLNGNKRKYKTPVAAAQDGLLYMAEEREKEGLISIASIKNNITISILGKLNKKGILAGHKEIEYSDQLIETLDIKCYSRMQIINQLSGGNKQKVMVGKVLAASPAVCLLDEPTRGVDIEAKDSILHSINEQMRLNSAVLITSPGLEDLIKICDRILVIFNGEIIEQFDRHEFNEQDIYRATQGEKIHQNAGEQNPQVI